MVGKKSRFGSGKISNMFDFSHGPNRQLPTLTERLGLSKFLKPTPKIPKSEALVVWWNTHISFYSIIIGYT